jgi:hypothetical protein
MLVISRRALALCLLLPLAVLAAAAMAQAPSAPPAPPLRAVGPQAGFGDQLVLGSGARLELGPADAGGHGALLLDGLEVGNAALAGPWSPGTHAVSVQAAAGAATTPAPLRFVYDPAAPTLKWEVGGTAMLDRHGMDEGEHRTEPPRRVEPERDQHVKLLWSPDGRRWLPVLVKGAQADASGALADWVIASDKPQVFLWALEEDVFGAGAPVTPAKLQIVRVWGADELSAVRELRLRVLAGNPADPGHAYQLELMATDLVGNQTKATWPLVRH